MKIGIIVYVANIDFRGRPKIYSATVVKSGPKQFVIDDWHGFHRTKFDVGTQLALSPIEALQNLKKQCEFAIEKHYVAIQEENKNITAIAAEIERWEKVKHA